MGSVHKHTFTAICPNKLYYRQANEAQQKLFWTCSLFCWTRSTNDVAIHKYIGQWSSKHTAAFQVLNVDSRK